MPIRSLITPLFLAPALFVVALAVSAWTDPTASPPSGNAPTPIRLNPRDSAGTPAALTDATTNVNDRSIWINRTGAGTGNLVELEDAGNDRFVVEKDGDVVVGSFGYLQFTKTFTGAPTATDCDSDAERGRMALRTDGGNERLYVCMGAARGWDYIALTN